jgi:hypothetical protein
MLNGSGAQIRQSCEPEDSVANDDDKAIFVGDGPTTSAFRGRGMSFAGHGIGAGETLSVYLAALRGWGWWDGWRWSDWAGGFLG